MLIRAVLVALCLALPAAAAPAAATPTAGSGWTIVYPGYQRPGDPRQDYFVRLLDLALSRTPEDGPYRFRMSDVPAVWSRAVALLRARSLSLMWAGTSNEMEERLLPVRVPALRGLLGHRIFIVRADGLDDFAQVKTLADLRRFKACQLPEWPDTAILRHAGIEVVTPKEYEQLFSQLARGRCDFIPRSVQEPFQEVAERLAQFPMLRVEPRLMLRYRMPMYYFVAPGDRALQDRLERGLRRALADGSWDALMLTHPSTRPIWDQADLAGRRVIDLENPILPPATPVGDADLWRLPVQHGGAGIAVPQ